MQTRNFQVLENFEQEVQAFLASTSFRSVLVQVFLGELEQSAIQEFANRLHRLLPKDAVVIGATTSGEILEGEMLEHAIVVSISLFKNTTLQATSIDCYESCEALGAAFVKVVVA